MGGNKVKCVVWDLDDTVWNGVLLEDRHVVLREGIRDIMAELDRRGILQSIASKNEESSAMGKLTEFGLADYFLYPQINWNAKSASIKKIAELININVDTLAFVDDQPFEREEVRFSIPQVLCIDAADTAGMLDMPELHPKFITEDSRLRRQMYLSDIARNKEEAKFEGPQEQFLSSLNMVFTISEARESDLQRAEELTMRTHQLNTTGYTYSYDELDGFRRSGSHKLLIAGLDDKYGTYGKIGVVLIECTAKFWTIKLLLMSCRVMSRGVGSILINYIMKKASEAGVKLRAEFISTDRNRMMYVTYKFAGFKEIEERGNFVLFENDLANLQPMPRYVEIKQAV